MRCWGLIIVATALCASVARGVEGPTYAEHSELTYVLEADGTRTPIRTEAGWQRRREHILQAMAQVMGPVPHPEPPTPLDVQKVEEHDEGGIVRRKVSYHTDRVDQRVTAWLLLPHGAAKRAAMLCLHQTTDAGKDETVGLAGRASMHYALELARRGFVTLAPDYPSLGEYKYDFDHDEYASGSMKAIYDNMRAIDLLQSLPEVDSSRVGCIGHSLGGHNGLYTAAFDVRIKAVASSCGFTRFARYMGGDLTGWSGPRYMPRIASEFGKSPARMPFDFTEVLAAIAPRAVFVSAPLADENFDVTGVRESVAAAEPVFRLLNAGQRLQVIYPEGGHDFPDAARQAAYRFLEEQLARQ